MDLTFSTEQGKFNYRVGAVITDGNKILMVKASDSPLYYSVGGRVKFGETAEQAILREVYEETGVEAEIDRSLFFHQNFFFSQESGEFYHELSVYFLIKNDGKFASPKCMSSTDRGTRETLHWLDIATLGELNVKPNFYATELRNIPLSPKFMITNEKPQ